MADPEITRAKQTVRQRERAVWSGVEQAGTAAVAQRQTAAERTTAKATAPAETEVARRGQRPAQ